MVRSGAPSTELVVLAFCEDCQTLMKPNEVRRHQEHTGHGTYNQKLLPRSQVVARLGQ
jgi:hypothetical protein